MRATVPRGTSAPMDSPAAQARPLAGRIPSRLAAPILGAICALGFQPLALWPLSLFGMGAFGVLLGQSRNPREAALLGWLFGVAHFTLGNNWIATAFTYQAEMPPALGWAAVPLLSLYLAVYPALAAWGARKLAGGQAGWALVFAFAGSWTIAEWLRGWVFTGFAWNPFGISLLGGFDTQGLAALVPWMGTYALSGLAVFLAGASALLVSERRLVPLGAVIALLVAGMHMPAGETSKGALPLTLVQPDLRQEDLDNPALFEAQFAHIARLTVPRRPGEKRLVLWPESGLPDYLRDGYPQSFYRDMTAGGDPAFARARLGRTIGDGGMLLTGAVDLVIDNSKSHAGLVEVTGARNVVTAIDAGGVIRGSYAKAHLVPYGEYLALRWLLEPLGARRLVAGALDFVPGPGPRTIDLGPWGKAGIQICYEITFAGEVVDPAHRPDYLFNPSNDGWFGSWGPPQHLAQARLRAIEEGLPVLRATTTGISAVIDGHGIVREHIGRLKSGRIDTLVPPALPPTPFARLGNLLSLVWAAGFLLLALVATRRRRG